MEYIEVFKINFSNRDSLETSNIYRHGNTRYLYDNCKDSYYTGGTKILEREVIKVEELQKKIENGEACLFSISVNTDTFNICNHAKLGITPYMAKPRYYEEFKDLYYGVNC